MKKLYEMGYVTRDMATKPYTYAITDAGKTAIQQVSVSAGA
jgi:predicted MarR family transcription regulator